MEGLVSINYERDDQIMKVAELLYNAHRPVANIPYAEQRPLAILETGSCSARLASGAQRMMPMCTSEFHVEQWVYLHLAVISVS